MLNTSGRLRWIRCSCPPEAENRLSGRWRPLYFRTQRNQISFHAFSFELPASGDFYADRRFLQKDLHPRAARRRPCERRRLAHRVQGPLPQLQNAALRQQQGARDHGRHRGGLARQPPLRDGLRARRLHLGLRERVLHDPQYRAAGAGEIPGPLYELRRHPAGHRRDPDPPQGDRRRASGHPPVPRDQGSGGCRRRQDGQPGRDQERPEPARAAGVWHHRPCLPALRRAQRPAGGNRPPHAGRRIRKHRSALLPERRDPATDHPGRGAARPRRRHPRGMVGDRARSRRAGHGGPAQQRHRRGRRRQLVCRPVPLRAERERRKRVRRLQGRAGQQIQPGGHQLPAHQGVSGRGRGHVRGRPGHGGRHGRRGHLHAQPGGYPRPRGVHQLVLGPAQGRGGRQRRLRPVRRVPAGADGADPGGRSTSRSASSSVTRRKGSAGWI